MSRIREKHKAYEGKEMNCAYQSTEWFRQSIEENADKWKHLIRNKILDQMINKEATKMKATYNGTTGELVKLERIRGFLVYHEDTPRPPIPYVLEIYDPEKKATVHFENVNLADVKFSGGEVSFNG